jgi:hypothetical protein
MSNSATLRAGRRAGKHCLEALRIKNFNEIFRHFNTEFLESNFSHTGLIRIEGCMVEKAMKMQGTMGVCTVEAGQCIQ